MLVQLYKPLVLGLLGEDRYGEGLETIIKVTVRFQLLKRWKKTQDALFIAENMLKWKQNYGDHSTDVKFICHASISFLLEKSSKINLSEKGDADNI